MPETPFNNCHLKLSELLEEHRIFVEDIAELKIYDRAVLTLIIHIRKLFIEKCLILIVYRINKEKQPEIKHLLSLLSLIILLD